MTIRDAILIPALLSPLVPAAIMGFTGHGWFFFWTVFAFYVCFGVLELISIKTRKRSISKDIALTPAPLFWSIIATWEVMQVGIGIHWWMMR